MWFLLAWALGATPTYNADDLTFTMKERTTAELRTIVESHLRDRKIAVAWRAGGEDVAVFPKPAGERSLQTLDRPALLALLLGLQPTTPEAMEYDLLFADDGKQIRPVSLWTEGPKRLVVAGGEPVGKPPAGPSAAQIAKRYGLAGLVEVDATFEPGVRGALDTALALLTDPERARLADITIVRQGENSRKVRATRGPKWVNTANYLLDGNVGWIEVYDDAVLTSPRFVGPVDAPLHPTVFVLLHELGHAIADAPTRAMLAEYERRRMALGAAIDVAVRRNNAYNHEVEAFNANKTPEAAARLEAQLEELTALGAELQAEREAIHVLGERIDALGELAPMAQRYRDEVGDAAPTAYGRTSADEAFAEAFALFHADPEALKRTVPAAYAWFARGSHVEERPRMTPVDEAMAAGPIYGTGALAPSDAEEARLRAELVARLGSRGLFDISGAPVDPGGADRPLLRALLATEDAWPGTERDLLVSDGSTAHPITVWVEADRLVVARGVPLAPAEVPPLAALVERHGIAPPPDGAPALEPPLRTAIDTSLALLNTEERDRLGAIGFVRLPADPEPTVLGASSALYAAGGHTIQVFDRALEPRGTFVGSVDHPHPALVQPLLHEVCHAIARAPTRALQAEQDARIAAFDALVDTHLADLETLRADYRKAKNVPEDRRRAVDARAARIAAEREAIHAGEARLAAWLETPPMVTAYAALGEPGPTLYGRLGGPEEAFCEAFALSHADPDALARVSPATAAWLARGGHLDPE